MCYYYSSGRIFQLSFQNFQVTLYKDIESCQKGKVEGMRILWERIGERHEHNQAYDLLNKRFLMILHQYTMLTAGGARRKM